MIDASATLLHSVRLCLNIHVSVRIMEEIHQPGEQKNSVVREW